MYQRESFLVLVMLLTAAVTVAAVMLLTAAVYVTGIFCYRGCCHVAV